MGLQTAQGKQPYLIIDGSGRAGCFMSWRPGYEIWTFRGTYRGALTAYPELAEEARDLGFLQWVRTTCRGPPDVLTPTRM